MEQQKRQQGSEATTWKDSWSRATGAFKNAAAGQGCGAFVAAVKETPAVMAKAKAFLAHAKAVAGSPYAALALAGSPYAEGFTSKSEEAQTAHFAQLPADGQKAVLEILEKALELAKILQKSPEDVKTAAWKGFQGLTSSEERQQFIELERLKKQWREVSGQAAVPKGCPGQAKTVGKLLAIKIDFMKQSIELEKVIVNSSQKEKEEVRAAFAKCAPAARQQFIEFEKLLAALAELRKDNTEWGQEAKWWRTRWNDGKSDKEELLQELAKPDELAKLAKALLDDDDLLDAPMQRLKKKIEKYSKKIYGRPWNKYLAPTKDEEGVIEYKYGYPTEGRLSEETFQRILSKWDPLVRVRVVLLGQLNSSTRLSLYWLSQLTKAELDLLHEDRKGEWCSTASKAPSCPAKRWYDIIALEWTHNARLALRFESETLASNGSLSEREPCQWKREQWTKFRNLSEEELRAEGRRLHRTNSVSFLDYLICRGGVEFADIGSPKTGQQIDNYRDWER